MYENETAWELWSLASKFDRPVGLTGYLPLSSLTMTDICERHDATTGDLEKMILLEEKLYPMLFCKKIEGE